MHKFICLHSPNMEFELKWSSLFGEVVLQYSPVQLQPASLTTNKRNDLFTTHTLSHTVNQCVLRAFDFDIFTRLGWVLINLLCLE